MKWFLDTGYVFSIICVNVFLWNQKMVYSLNRFFTNQRKSSDHFSNATLVKYVPIQQGEPQSLCGIFLLWIYIMNGILFFFFFFLKINVIHYIHMVDVLFWVINKIANIKRGSLHPIVYILITSWYSSFS